MPDLDAIRGQSTLVVASLEWRVNPDAAGLHHNIPHAVIDAAHSMALHVPDLLAALATAEAEREILTRSRDGWKADAERETGNRDYWKARADAAEQERDKMRADALRAYRKAKGEACGLDLDERCYRCEREFNALVPLRAALARGEGENATRTGDPRPEGSGEG